MTEAKVTPAETASDEELYRTHHPRVVKLCRLLLADSGDAEEVAQEVFIKVFRQRRIQTQPIAWGPWITRVAVNACHDRRRSGWWRLWRHNYPEFAEADFPANSPTPEDELLGRERRAQIWRHFERLSPRQREVFVLRQVEGWSTHETAEALHMTPGSVKTHLFRAVHQLRKVLRGNR